MTWDPVRSMNMILGGCTRRDVERTDVSCTTSYEHALRRNVTSEISGS